MNYAQFLLRIGKTIDNSPLVIAKICQRSIIKIYDQSTMQPAKEKSCFENKVIYSNRTLLLKLGEVFLLEELDLVYLI